jgi:hypothetical protein
MARERAREEKEKVKREEGEEKSERETGGGVDRWRI